MDRTATLDSSWILSGTNTPEHKFHPSPKRSIRFWDNRAEFFTYDDLSASKLTDEQALFCPSSVPCFDLATQKQPIIAVSSLCPVDWNKDALKQLVLPDDKKERIGCLLQNYASGTVQGLCNVIPGKGAVRSFLPHCSKLTLNRVLYSSSMDLLELEKLLRLVRFPVLILGWPANITT